MANKFRNLMSKHCFQCIPSMQLCTSQ